MYSGMLKIFTYLLSDNAKEPVKARGTDQRHPAQSSSCGQIFDTEGSYRGRVLSGRNAIAEERSSKGG